jgi:UDP-glucuronate decarboxylase
MHVLVTGGTGFFGKALLRYWANSDVNGLTGARFTLLSRDPSHFRAVYGELLSRIAVTLVQGDIQIADTLPEGRYTHILHAATESTKGPSLTPLEQYDQIVDGTRNVLELARRSGQPRVLLTSSGGVYGSIAQLVDGVAEGHHGIPDPLESRNAYSLAKRQAEHLCALYHDRHGVDTVIARCFAFVGEDLPLNAHFAIGNFLRDALMGQNIVVNGDGSPVRSYLHQHDLAHWLTVLLLQGAPQRAYNVGSDEPISLAALAAKVAELAQAALGRKPAVRIMGRDTVGPSATRTFYLPDITRARNELGLSVTISLDEAITQVLRAKFSSCTVM